MAKMKITQLYTYPIKALRPTALTSSTLTRHGFTYDRRFMLLKLEPAPKPPQNMHLSLFLEMCLFTTDIIFPENDTAGGKVIVTYNPPPRQGEEYDETGIETKTTLEIPLQPSIEALSEVIVDMNFSPTTAYDMGEEYNSWFSKRFGFDVMLVYSGEHRRGVKGSFAPSVANKKGNETSSSGGGGGGALFSGITKAVSYFGGKGGEENEEEEEGITFSDVAPYLVVSETSRDNVSSRLPEGEDMDITKFRPNIVVSGAGEAFEEDFWAEIVIKDADGDNNNDAEKAKFHLTQNCNRCLTINVDFETGKTGQGESGTVLKKLMKDRRVDKGTKYNPIFGRYGFLDREGVGCVIRVGDEVVVSRRNEEHTVFGK
ncbi:hypothetical protein AJ80_04638 [Polytolypa hystricis UAMH7299]|uniref:MOSC domain-containing protein n=1 Tax=Polytolypa hystricis (strain UAMH7299) TaxID=1447883 RepID=A0A2B7YBP4_POLH7|nr:hypothetical protein AJ80_04638 [Polytolypa hystricis UAMH7299]